MDDGHGNSQTQITAFDTRFMTRLLRVFRPFMYCRCLALLARRKCAGPWVTFGQYCTTPSVAKQGTLSVLTIVYLVNPSHSSHYFVSLLFRVNWRTFVCRNLSWNANWEKYTDTRKRPWGWMWSEKAFVFWMQWYTTVAHKGHANLLFLKWIMLKHNNFFFKTKNCFACP
jgi:hypothetical protein